MDNELIVNLKTKINERHNFLLNGLKKSVQIAIEIGGYLQEVKNNIQHGKWEKWVKENCNFTNDTANRYIKLNAKTAEIGICKNLQEAYKQIECLERQEKQKKEKEQLKKVIHFKNTGEKPDNWDRSDDYAYKKYCDNKKYEERKQKILDEKKKKIDENIDVEMCSNNINNLINEAMKYENEKQKIIESTSGNEDIIYQIEGVLQKLENDQRRHEFCNTLIKYLRKKSIEYSKF